MNIKEQSTKTTFKGVVVKGRQIGRTIGFPTANLDLDVTTDVNLKKGVYGVKVTHKGTVYDGMMNIGVRPTFKDGNPAVSYEIHILNFDKMIYGDELEVKVLFFIRDEVAFQSKEQLIQQINKDIEQSKQGLLELERLKFHFMNDKSM